MRRVRLSGFKYFENVDSVRDRLLKASRINVTSEEVSIEDSVGRVCAEDVRASRNYPPYNRSAVDGLAVRSEDVSSASQDSPIELRIVGTLEAGSSKDLTISEGEAAIVYTGARIPNGADSVVPFEFVELRGSNALVFKPVPRLGNVSREGEDLREGDLIIGKGSIIRPWHIAAMAESCISRVKVYSPIKIAIINTGDELVDYRLCNSEEIVNSSGPLITAYVKELGCEVTLNTIVRDDINEIREAIRKALKSADVVVTTGGSSIGGKDVVPEALEGIENSELIFHGVNLRPGRTAGAYVINGKPVIMLSGLPVACLVGLENFLKPLIIKAYGLKLPPEPSVEAILTRRIANVVGFRSYYRMVAYVEGGRIYAEPLRLTGSGIISSLIKGNAILEVPENIEGYDEGSVVKIRLISPLYIGRPSFLKW